MLQPAAVPWCETYQKAWMMTTTYAWSCISLQFLKTAAHDHAIVIVTLTCSLTPYCCIPTPTFLPSVVLHHACCTAILLCTVTTQFTWQYWPSQILCCSTKLQSLLMQQVSESIDCVQAHKNWVQCVSWSPDAVMVVSGDQNGVLWLWQPKTGETIGACRGSSPILHFAVLSACLSILVQFSSICSLNPKTSTSLQNVIPTLEI